MFDNYWSDCSNVQSSYCGDADMTPTGCAQLCTQQPLCLGLSWKDFGRHMQCVHWFPDGQAENLGASYDRWHSYLMYTGDGSIQGGETVPYYDEDTRFDCYRKGILITQFRKNSCQKS